MRNKLMLIGLLLSSSLQLAASASTLAERRDFAKRDPEAYLQKAVEDLCTEQKRAPEYFSTADDCLLIREAFIKVAIPKELRSRKLFQKLTLKGKDAVAKMIKKRLLSYSAQNIEQALAYIGACKVRLKAIINSKRPTMTPDEPTLTILTKEFPMDRVHEPAYFKKMLALNPGINSASFQLYKDLYEEYRELEHKLMEKRWDIIMANGDRGPIDMPAQVITNTEEKTMK